MRCAGARCRQTLVCSNEPQHFRVFVGLLLSTKGESAESRPEVIDWGLASWFRLEVPSWEPGFV